MQSIFIVKITIGNKDYDYRHYDEAWKWNIIESFQLAYSLQVLIICSVKAKRKHDKTFFSLYPYDQSIKENHLSFWFVFIGLFYSTRKKNRVK